MLSLLDKKELSLNTTLRSGKMNHVPLEWACLKIVKRPKIKNKAFSVHFTHFFSQKPDMENTLNDGTAFVPA